MGGQANVKPVEVHFVSKRLETKWVYSVAGALLGIPVAMKSYKLLPIFAFAAGAEVDKDLAIKKREIKMREDAERERVLLYPKRLETKWVYSVAGALLGIPVAMKSYKLLPIFAFAAGAVVDKDLAIKKREIKMREDAERKRVLLYPKRLETEWLYSVAGALLGIPFAMKSYKLLPIFAFAAGAVVDKDWAIREHAKCGWELLYPKRLETKWLYAVAGALLGIPVAMKSYKLLPIFAFAAGAVVDNDWAIREHAKCGWELLYPKRLETKWVYSVAGALLGIPVAMKSYKLLPIFAFAAGAVVDKDLAIEIRESKLLYLK